MRQIGNKLDIYVAMKINKGANACHSSLASWKSQLRI